MAAEVVICAAKLTTDSNLLSDRACLVNAEEKEDGQYFAPKSVISLTIEILECLTAITKIDHVESFSFKVAMSDSGHCFTLLEIV